MAGTRIEQTALTVVLKLRNEPAKVKALSERIATLGQGDKRVLTFPFERVPTIHFARWVVVNASTGKSKRKYDPLLLFEANYDGTDDAKLFDDMLAVMSEGMHEIHALCVDYPAKKPSDAALRDILLRNRLPAGAFHIAHYGRTAQTIIDESKIRNHLEAFFDRKRGELYGLSAEKIRERALEEVERAIAAKELPALPDLFDPPHQWPDPRRWPTWFLVALAVGVLPVSLTIGAAFLYIRHLEKNEENAPVVHPAEHIAAVSRLEDIDQQNPLTHLVEVKDSAFRRLTLRVVLFVVKYFAKLHFNRGDLGGIRSIHFARWVVIDEGKRLLFFSNYDGSWERYLGDFIDQAAMGLTAVWTNTEGFPPARFLLWKGSTYEDQFKAWTRDRQIDTQLWFTAYPQLSNREIEANAKIRRGLDREVMKKESATEWLESFMGGGAAAGSASDPAAGLPEVPTKEQPPLDRKQIQAVVLKGLGEHRFSTFMVVDLGAKGAVASVVSLLAAEATCVDDHKKDVVVNAGFTSTGLDKIGVSKETLATFGPEFQEGIAKPARAKTLGDVGESDPSTWDWGRFEGEKRVDALVLVYGRTKDACLRKADELRAAVAAGGGHVVWEKHAEMLSDRKEHFGFVDGISQPKVRGLKREWTKEETTAAGEFVFGYPNSYVDVPDAPTLKGPEAEAARSEKALGDCLGAGKLGAEGTYIVARDLRQDVAAFNRFVRDQAKVVHPDKSDADAKGLFEAYCVGRWKDGTPLASNTADGKDLTFADDLHGKKCPITAHVRRSHPRDSLTLNPVESRIIADRHRILRRGRNFGDFIAEGSFDDDDPSREKRGMFFMCVNTNIARQFEFIQQTWLQSQKFGGLRSDRDPLLGREPPFTGRPEEKPPAPSMTVATPPLRARVPIAPFVTVRGGGYFFVPSLRAMKLFAWLAARKS